MIMEYYKVFHQLRENQHLVISKYLLSMVLGYLSCSFDVALPSTLIRGFQFTYLRNVRMDSFYLAQMSSWTPG